MDEDLRSLERAAGHDPAACLRFLAALERVGRKDDAFLFLCALKHHPDVRRELARWPAWTHPHGGPGGTYWLDVKPVRRAPRVRWRVRIGRAWGCVASAFGVVAVEESSEGSRFIAFDPDTGGERRSVPLAERHPGLGETHPVLRGDLLIEACQGRPGIVRDVATGEAMGTLEGRVMFVHEDLVIVEDDLGHACAFEWAHGRGPVSPEPLWRAQGVRSFRGGTTTLMGLGTAAVGLDRRSGQVVWSLPWAGRYAMSDGAGAVVSGSAHEPRLVEADGTCLAAGWAGTPAALGPSHVVMRVREAKEVRWSIHARDAFGRALRFAHTPQLRSSASWAGAREVFCLALETTRIGAFAVSGEALWEWPVERPPFGNTIVEVVAYPGRLYVLTESELICLEEA